MDISIYYISEYQGVLVTSDFAEIQRRMDIGMDPRTEYILMSLSDFDQFTIKSIGFDKVDDMCFQSLKGIFIKHAFETIAFHHSTTNLSDVVLNVKHIIIGEGSKINLGQDNFNNLEEITFLSVKTFKGKILDKISSVHRLTLWYANHKSNELLDLFPGLEKLSVFNGGLEIIDLTKNPMIKHLDLHRCLKLTEVKLNPSTQLQLFMVEACKKLSPVDFHRIHSDE